MIDIRYHKCEKQMDVIDNKELIRKRFSLLLEELNAKKRYYYIMETSLDIQRIGVILRKRKLKFE